MDYRPPAPGAYNRVPSAASPCCIASSIPGSQSVPLSTSRKSLLSGIHLRAERKSRLATSLGCRLAFRDVDGQASHRGLLVNALHIPSGLAHGRDHLIQRNKVRTIKVRAVPYERR